MRSSYYQRLESRFINTQVCRSLISDVTLDSFENTRTLHVAYLSPLKNLTSEDTRPVREKILAKALSDFGAKLKS